MESKITSFLADARFGFVDHRVDSVRKNHPHLIDNDGSNTMLRAIKYELRRSDSFLFSVAFVTPGALALLKQDLLEYRGSGTIITSTYLQFNSPDVFRELMAITNLNVKVVADGVRGFHSKGYIFSQPDGLAAIVGSSNLTRRALLQNDEWNLKFSAMPDGDIVRQLSGAAARQAQCAVALSEEWIGSYEDSWNPILPSDQREAGVDALLPTGKIRPNAMQEDALEAIRQIRSSGARRALVVSATGTGKTILAALAAKEIDPARLLFVAHREQILDKATEEFSRVLEVPAQTFGRLAGGERSMYAQHVFATVQSLQRTENLHSFDPSAFDLIIVDEVHRAGARTYLKILDYFTPEFLLGLTATPERSDEFSVYELFDFNVPYEIRLQQALEEDMLSPFNYYGVVDYTDAEGNTIDDTSRLARLTAVERVDHIVSTLKIYGHPVGARGLMFCSRNDEAKAISAALNGREWRGRRLRTVALSGADSVALREAEVRRLEAGELDYILTVDIFNEGIDIPSVNQVVMLRNTQSSIIFTQQLGRGLRKALGKDHLRVVDFIGNYSNNFLIPIALFGDSSLNKDVLRRKLLESQTSGAIAGVSSISFEEVSRRRIFESLARVNLDSMPNLKRAVLDMQHRLGGVPRLLDFARFDAVDPLILASKKGNFWNLLLSFKLVSEAPTTTADRYLKYLSTEVLNGKRPHELVLLKALLGRPGEGVHVNRIRSILLEQGCAVDGGEVESVIRILNFEFFTKQDLAKYGSPMCVEVEGRFRLSRDFLNEYETSEDFRRHVDDVLETGLYLARHRYDWSTPLQLGQRYTRKDVCRLLNWRSDQKGVMYGYKTDSGTNTCPIFITYHKSDEVSESTAYGDAFLDERTIRWFTRSNRTLASGEVREILSGEGSPALHIFVKKDDVESVGDFYYLGTAMPQEPTQETMSGANGSSLNVVTMKLSLNTPTAPELYDYLVGAAMAAPRPASSLPSDWTTYGRVEGQAAGDSSRYEGSSRLS